MIKTKLKCLFLFVFMILMVSVVYSESEWMQMLGDDGRIWFANYQYYQYSPGNSNNNKGAMVEGMAVEFRKLGAVEMNPTNLQWEAINKILGLYRTGKNDRLIISIGRNAADSAIFGKSLYVFYCEFTSATKYNYCFFKIM